MYYIRLQKCLIVFKVFSIYSFWYHTVSYGVYPFVVRPFGICLSVVVGGFGWLWVAGWSDDHFATISTLQSPLMSVCVCPCIILEIFTHPHTRNLWAFSTFPIDLCDGMACPGLICILAKHPGLGKYKSFRYPTCTVGIMKKRRWNWELRDCYAMAGNLKCKHLA